jgi:DNA-binding MarR family transcriptional regulator
MSADARRAWQLLVKFFFAQREHLPTACHRLELSPAQCHVLHLIEPGRPVPMRRLAQTLSCDASNVTGLVDRLEAHGLVERRTASGDRRVRMIQLTPEGSRVRSELLARMTAGPLPLARLSPADRQALVRILERLVSDEFM